ncbi:CYFA0S07e02146g1_1 [Cyberlindnera fabianii]|uniref:CYFA0S07e02146g1_1 n=1 Tax=Cyberlindnera fabianii TaxID=36022 RepID=A0A061B364_CYBFA|nr:CYFA0S07e02146g1_1 [Cyberlindnera fabianii]
MINQLEDFFVSRLAHFELFSDHMSHPISRRITTIALTGIIAIIIYKLIFQIGVLLGYWDIPGKEYFIDTPVHCAHVYVDSHAIVNGIKVHSKPLTYHIEFSPEEYNVEDPDLGSTLGFLRKKCYFLFKDSSLYEELKSPHFTFDNVEIYTSKGKILTQDEKPLCLQGVETGNKLNVVYNLES